MNILPTLLQGISLVPAIVSGIENIFGGRSGAEKKTAAVAFLQAALSMSDAVMSRQIIDEAKFKQGLGEIIDGVVECLNASTWAKTGVATNASTGAVWSREAGPSTSLRYGRDDSIIILRV